VIFQHARVHRLIQFPGRIRLGAGNSHLGRDASALSIFEVFNNMHNISENNSTGVWRTLSRHGVRIANVEK